MYLYATNCYHQLPVKTLLSTVFVELGTILLKRFIFLTSHNYNGEEQKVANPYPAIILKELSK